MTKEEIKNNFKILAKRGFIIKFKHSHLDIRINFDDKFKEMIISFDGTQRFAQWFWNFIFFATPYKKMKYKYYIPYGFKKMYHEVRDSLIEIIKDKNPKKLLVGGHSLGGAMSQLLYEDALFNFKDSGMLIDGLSFGSPAVFSSLRNKNIIKERMKDFILIENGDDMVTRLLEPFYYMKASDKIIPIGIRKYKYWIQALVRLKSYTDHFVCNYRKSIDKY